jgi:O-antigen/teichoic acid export membrane protein
LVLGLPIAVGGWALADQLIPFLFKAAYLPAVPALQIVIWAAPLMFTSEFLGYVVLIAGQERRVARSVIISTSVNVVANLLLVPMFGLLGAAIMTVLTEAVLVGQYLWILRAMLRRFNWGTTLLRPLLAALSMGIQVLALRDLPLVTNIALAALTYGILLFLLGVLGRDELRFIRDLRQHSEAVS